MAATIDGEPCDWDLSDDDRSALRRIHGDISAIGHEHWNLGVGESLMVLPIDQPSTLAVSWPKAFSRPAVSSAILISPTSAYFTSASKLACAELAAWPKRPR